MESPVRVLTSLTISLALSQVFILSSAFGLSHEQIVAINPALRSAAQQIADNQWIGLPNNFSEKGNLVIGAIKTKHPDWLVTTAPLLFKQFQQAPADLVQTYSNKPILIFATGNGPIEDKNNNEVVLRLNVGQDQPSIQAFPASEKDREYMLSREPGWVEVLLCRLDIHDRSLSLQHCSPQGTTLEEAINDADESILEALMGEGKTLSAIQAAVAASEVAKAYPKGPLSFEEGMQYAQAVAKTTNALSFDTDPKKFMEIATSLGYSKTFIEKLLSSNEDTANHTP
ncbi:MAG: hypothetical protein LUC43_10015 [Burkholderiales bacterium]|nr:hypothetical protein [Burkholderiales bacterium]